MTRTTLTLAAALALLVLACGDNDPAQLAADGSYLEASIAAVTESVQAAEEYRGNASFGRYQKSGYEGVSDPIDFFSVRSTADVNGASRSVFLDLFGLEPRPGDTIQLEAISLDAPAHAGATILYLADDRYLSAEGELVIGVVTDEQVTGTFWFRAFRQECHDEPVGGFGGRVCTTTPPDDPVWIRVEGEFSATPGPGAEQDDYWP